MEMLITQALDERDLLKKRIINAIDSGFFVSARKVDSNKDLNGYDIEKIEADAKATYQSIVDMIDRYYMIIQKIAESNALTKINVRGKEMTISAAISILKDISNDNYIKSELQERLERDYHRAFDRVSTTNSKAETTKLTLLQALLGKGVDVSQASQEQINAVEETVKKDYAELVDPIDVVEKLKTLKDENISIKSEILSAIKISNATTTIDI